MVAAAMYRAQLGVNTAQERLARVADEVVVTSPSYRDLLAEAGVPGAHVIPWGVDAVAPAGADTPEDVTARSNGPLRVLFVGQMRPYKGVPVLLEALDGLPGVEATLVGGGLDEQQYRELARRRA